MSAECGARSVESVNSRRARPASGFRRGYTIDPMNSKNDNLKDRTKRFALNVLELSEDLRTGIAGNILLRQLLRAGTSVGANYRAACRARSTADFINKVGLVEEEADETGYWLELLVESNRLPVKRAKPLLDEASELTAIMVASANTARRRARPAAG